MAAIQNWLRSRDNIEFAGLWKSLKNSAGDYSYCNSYLIYVITRVCHLPKNNFKVKQRNFEICLTFLAPYGIIIM